MSDEKLSDRMNETYGRYTFPQSWIDTVRDLEEELEHVTAERDEAQEIARAAVVGEKDALVREYLETRRAEAAYAEGRCEALLEALNACKACDLIGADECEEAIRALLDEEKP